MSAEYPGALKSFTTKTNKVDLVDAEHVNSLQEEVVAIETELGIDVAGSVTDLKTRIYVCIDNDGAIRKGTSFPGTTKAGQMFFKTDEDTLYVRNAANDGWDVSLVGDASITQAKLKTSMGSVSKTGSPGATWTWGLLTLPGGTYGFYPQTKLVSTGGAAKGLAETLGYLEASPLLTLPDTGDTGYATQISLGAYGAQDNKGTVYAQQRYITASGKNHWIFLLVDKITGNIAAGYQAPDHPCYGSNRTEEDIPHPFGNYNDSKYEVVLIDNEILNQTKLLVTSRRSLLTIINEEYEVDMVSVPIYQPREIIEIDEYGDKPGEIIKEMETPEWAKIVIGSDKIYLKKRMVNVLPAFIKYKKLKKKV